MWIFSNIVKYSHYADRLYYKYIEKNTHLRSASQCTVRLNDTGHYPSYNGSLEAPSLHMSARLQHS